MIRRVCAMVLCLALTLACFCLPTFAATDEEVNQIRKQITRDFYRALAISGRESLNGYCGLQTSLQLHLMGINESRVIKNGKDQYDTYCNMDFTSGGYRVKAYPAALYSMREALNAVSKHGTRDVYNILVGFNWTNTPGGSVYGHAVVIYAILDGMVYFTEGFSTPMNGTPGGAIACTIDRFVRYYDDWTQFEGLVHFGNKSYVDSCDEYVAQMYVELNHNARLYTEPCNPELGEVDSQIVRTAVKGEQLWVTALYENTADQLYYRVDDNGTVCYVAANWADPVSFDLEDITLHNLAMPNTLAAGADFHLQGETVATKSQISALHLVITDKTGQVMLTNSLVEQNGQYDLSDTDFNAGLNFSTLPKGDYRYELRAELLSFYAEKQNIRAQLSDTVLLAGDFQVGDFPQETQPTAPEAQPLLIGWQYMGDTWYYYENGKPRTGWFCYAGQDYYLKADGSVTTGRAVINGKPRLFTSNGVMRTGWVETPEGRQYLLSNGVPACGWRKIDDNTYYFDNEGILQCDSWLELQGEQYYLLSNGSVATGWKELPEGKFCFDVTDGHLVSKA